MFDERMQFSSLNCLSSDDVESLRAVLQQRNYRCYEVNGSRMSGAASLYRELVAVLPQDPPLSGRRNWDAFEDSVWEGLESAPEEKFAILWHDSHLMLGALLPEFLRAVVVIDGLTASLATTKHGASRPKEVLLFLIGRGDGFKALG